MGRLGLEKILMFYFFQVVGIGRLKFFGFFIFSFFEMTCLLGLVLISCALSHNDFLVRFIKLALLPRALLWL